MSFFLGLRVGLPNLRAARRSYCILDTDALVECDVPVYLEIPADGKENKVLYPHPARMQGLQPESALPPRASFSRPFRARRHRHNMNEAMVLLGRKGRGEGACALGVPGAKRV